MNREFYSAGSGSARLEQMHGRDRRERGMTEREAEEILTLDDNQQKEFPMLKDAYAAAVRALKEVRRYREMEQRLESVYGDCDGLLEKAVEHLVKHENTDIPEPVFKAVLLTDDEADMREEYKSIGTVEECREAVEKQEPVRPKKTAAEEDIETVKAGAKE